MYTLFFQQQSKSPCLPPAFRLARLHRKFTSEPVKLDVFVKRAGVTVRTAGLFLYCKLSIRSLSGKEWRPWVTATLFHRGVFFKNKVCKQSHWLINGGTQPAHCKTWNWNNWSTQPSILTRSSGRDEGDLVPNLLLWAHFEWQHTD